MKRIVMAGFAHCRRKSTLYEPMEVISAAQRMPQDRSVLLLPHRRLKLFAFEMSIQPEKVQHRQVWTAGNWRVITAS